MPEKKNCKKEERDNRWQNEFFDAQNTVPLGRTADAAVIKYCPAMPTRQSFDGRVNNFL